MPGLKTHDGIKFVSQDGLTTKSLDIDNSGNPLFDSQELATSNLVENTANILAPSGQIAFFARSTAPSGWVKANGAAISRSTYSALFSAIGTTFGSGDGSTTFNLPDLRGEFLRGWDDSRGIDSARSFASFQDYDWKGFYMMNTGQSTYTYNHSEEYHGKSTTEYTGRTFAGSWAAPAAAIGTKWDTSEIRPRNIALLACIKY